MKRVAFHNLGCKVNSYELDIMRQKMEEHGYISVPFEEEAEVYVINTCTVTNIADRKSRQMIHKAKKKNPEAVVNSLQRSAAGKRTQAAKRRKKAEALKGALWAAGP